MTTPVREYIDVSPSNGTGTASYKDGNPIVNFVIGAQERFLLGSTIRLNGKFTTYNSANHDSTQNLATETPGLAMDPRLGVFAVIDSLSVSSHQTINIYGVPQYLSQLPVMGTSSDTEAVFSTLLYSDGPSSRTRDNNCVTIKAAQHAARLSTHTTPHDNSAALTTTRCKREKDQHRRRVSVLL